MKVGYFLLVIIQLFFFKPGTAQSENWIDPEIEKLVKSVELDPGNSSIRQKLISRYLQIFQLNLAKIELADAKKGIKGFTVPLYDLFQMEFQSGYFEKAATLIQKCYLLNPDPVYFLDLGMTEEARGNHTVAMGYLQQAVSTLPTASTRMLRLYQKFKVNNLPVQAAVALKIINSTFPDQLSVLFPTPKIEIISPGKYFPTELAQLNMTFQVTHSRPVKTIRVNNHLVFDGRDRKDIPFEEPFSRVFTESLRLTEGLNVYSILTEDWFGFSSADSCEITNIQFVRKPEWTSFWSDSLVNGLKLLSSYLPDSVIQVETDPAFRSLLISGSFYDDSTDFFDSGLLFHEWLSNPATSRVQKKNSKLLLNENDRVENLSLLINTWLVPATTFQSVTVLFLSGYWEISDQSWMLEDATGSGINMKQVLEELVNVASSGNWIFIDGPVKNRPLFESELEKLAAKAVVGTTICFLPDSVNWKDTLTTRLSQPDFYNQMAMNPDLPTPDDFSGFKLYRSSSSVSLPLFYENPAVKAKKMEFKLSVAFNQQIQKEKIKKAEKEKLSSFYSNWKFFNEVSRYLKAELTVTDLQTRMDEFLTRTEK